MLLHKLGRSLRILQRLLQQRVDLQELLRQDRVLQYRLQERVLLQQLAAGLLVLALGLSRAIACAGRGAELLQHALLQHLVQQGMLLHDLACQQRMLQCLLQQRVLLDQLGRGLWVLQGGLYDRMRLEELLRQDRLLQDGLQQRMLLQDLPARLLATRLALGVGTEGLRAAREAAPGLPELSAGLAAAERAANATANAAAGAAADPAADGPAQQAAEAAAAQWLELLLSRPELFELSHVSSLVMNMPPTSKPLAMPARAARRAEGLRRRDQRSHKRVRYRGLDREGSTKFVGGTPRSATFAVAHGGGRLPLRPGGQPGNTRPHRVK
jgi:hypothetical protein